MAAELIRSKQALLLWKTRQRVRAIILLEPPKRIHLGCHFSHDRETATNIRGVWDFVSVGDDRETHMTVLRSVEVAV